MKNLFFSFCFLCYAFIFMHGQEPILIDHRHIDLSQIPDNWIDSAKAKLFIAYGHTSHGSQITSGMDALESYFSSGKFNWSHDGGEGNLHLFEGSGYNPGDLDHDAGYSGWDDKTRAYLNDHPECNVIVWSWCGQVDEVNLRTHYLAPMQQLEDEYPDVKFVYMTGHLEGKGPEGSVYAANKEIRDSCMKNNKILFDFADIEKYAPFGTINFQEYYADDDCYYDPDGVAPIERTENWALNWLNDHPSHELTAISSHCNSCSHSVSINCVKKGIAAWYLWLRLAGWNEPIVNIRSASEKGKITLFPNPVSNYLRIQLPYASDKTRIRITDISGKLMYSYDQNSISDELMLSNLHLPSGLYFLILHTTTKTYSKKFIVQ